jgi:Ca2+-binding EF-hand superfamily protein
MYLMSYLTKSQLKYENLMTKIFNEFDLDGDGLIKMDDLKQFMKINSDSSIQLNDQDIVEMIKVADLNNDGFVDMEGKINDFILHSIYYLSIQSIIMIKLNCII